MSDERDNPKIDPAHELPWPQGSDPQRIGEDFADPNALDDRRVGKNFEESQFSGSKQLLPKRGTASRCTSFCWCSFACLRW